MKRTATLRFVARDIIPALMMAIALGLMIVPAGVTLHAEDRSPVIGVPSNDAEMNAAIEKARVSLATFWASYASPKSDEHDHALKVRFPTSGSGSEHIWVANVKKLADGTFAGHLANQPLDLAGKNEGDPVEFKAADISDWMFMRKDKIVGGETLRAMFKSMPKEDADALRAQMETP